MNVACGPERHQHPPIRRQCSGCHRLVCGPDDGWKTTTGRVFVCEECLARYRPRWMAGR